MLYAARAALSEEDRYTKTHRGTWDLFWTTFVATVRVDESLASEARALRELREPWNCEAKRPGAPEAEGALDLAERFVGAVEELIGD
jgi:uncharacterized protein (UPF0332 family)